jgi:hypothetical protein
MQEQITDIVLTQTEVLPQAARQTVACIDLYQSHALERVYSVLQSFNEGFVRSVIDASPAQEDELIDIYTSERFYIAYRMREGKRDQLQVSWLNGGREGKHSDAELLALARQIASLLGGGTNLHFWETSS